LFFFCTSIVLANDVTGFWQTIDKKTRLPTSVIAIYPYQGKYYGKIIATCDKEGVITETLNRPKSRAPGVAGNPHYCGLDIIWSCVPDGAGSYKGYVVDPREGKRYNARIWKENGNLILRGEVLMFGRNEVLTQFPKENFNKNFTQPTLSNLFPSVYKLKN